MVTSDEPGWRHFGEIPISFSSAERSIQKRALRDGWRPGMREELSARRPRAGLHLWESGESKVIVLIWEIHVGLTGIAWSPVNTSTEDNGFDEPSGLSASAEEDYNFFIPNDK